MYRLRLKAYQPGTDTPLGFLPVPMTIEASFPHNDAGALTVKYSTLADGGPLAARSLATGLDVALQVDWGNGWFDPDNNRFLMVRRGADANDPMKLYTLTFVAWGWLLAKIRNLKTTGLEGSKSKYAGQRKMSNKDAGDIMKTFLNEHDERSGPAVPIIRDSWTTSVDSAGHTWTKKKTLYYDVGTDLLTVLDGLAGNNMCDWRTRGRGLRMYNADTNFVDRADTVVLGYGSDVTEAPSEETSEDMVARLLVRGDGKHKVTVKDPTITEHYGRWEGVFDDSGVKDEDDLEDDGQEQLDAANRPQTQYTRQLTLAGDFLPFRDYEPGDWITAPALEGRERMRVQQVTLTLDESKNVGGNLILADRILASELKVARRLGAVTGGTSGTGGSGVIAKDNGPDNRVPAAPTGLTLTDSITPDPFGRHVAKLTASWTPVTTATDGTDLEIQGYELWGQPQTTPAAEWRFITGSASSPAQHQPFDVGSTWMFFVRALGVTTTEAGAQSATATIAFGVDTVAPNQPSTPTAINSVGAVVVTWNGLDASGGAMPVDFKRCEVHVSATSGFDPRVTGAATRKASFIRGGTVTLTGLPVGAPLYIKLLLFDFSENPSVPSNQATITPQRLVTADLTQDMIDETLLADGAVTNDKVAVRSLLGSRMVLTDFTNRVENPGFELGNLTAWTQTGGWAVNSASPHGGTYKAQVSPAAGTTAVITSDSTIEVAPGDQWVVAAWMNNDMTHAAASTAIGIITDTGTVAAATFTGNAPGWQRYLFTYDVPAGVKTIRVRIAASSGASGVGSARLDDVYLRRANNAELIVDGAITANKLETEMVIANNIYLGDPSASHVALNDAGILRMRWSPEVGALLPGFSLGGDSADWFTFRNAEGIVTATLDDDGHGEFASVNANDIGIEGISIKPFMRDSARGMVMYALQQTNSPGVTNTTEQVWVEFRCTVEPGRLYKVSVSGHLVDATSTGSISETKVRYAINGAVTTASDQLIGSPIRRRASDTSQDSNVPYVGILDTGNLYEADEARFIYTICQSSGGGTAIGIASANFPLIVTVEDVGPSIAASTTAVTYKTTWMASATQAKNSNGTARTDATYLGYDQSPITVGACGTPGNWSQILFNNVAIGGEAKTVAAAMAGATLVKAELFLHCQYAGGTSDISLYGRTATAFDTTEVTTGAIAAAFKEGQEKWVNLPLGSTISTALRSIQVGRGEHCHFRGATAATVADRPQLRLTYRRIN